MKKEWIIIPLGIAAVAAIAIAAFPRAKRPMLLPPMKVPGDTMPIEAAAEAPLRDRIARPEFASLHAKESPTSATPVAAAVPGQTSDAERKLARAAADYLLHPEVTYAERRDLWGQLGKNGQLNSVVAELERRAAEETNNPAIPANLGQGYLLQAAAATGSIAEQGILGMKADRTFDQALALDDKNWEARFWKAAAMSYWPSVLNKSQDVMANFVKLIEQQEAEAPQPQFVDTYVWLSKEYAKGGHADYARQACERGLAFFPANTRLAAQLQALAK